MPRLFTYIIPVDDGAAPNPFHGLCTLAICKPRIRSVAETGDWVAAFGSARAPGLRGKLVYAMEVAKVVTMQEYDEMALAWWPHRIPDLRSSDLRTKLGDCIYDYSDNGPRQRPGVHGSQNERTDLSGKNVLISDNFVYFGRNAIEIIESLKPICPTSRGHRSNANQPHVNDFSLWMSEVFEKHGKGQLGWPDMCPDFNICGRCSPCDDRRIDGESDRELVD